MKHRVTLLLVLSLLVIPALAGSWVGQDRHTRAQATLRLDDYPESTPLVLFDADGGIVFIDRNKLGTENEADAAFARALELNPGLLRDLGRAALATLPQGFRFPAKSTGELRIVNRETRRFVEDQLQGYLEEVAAGADTKLDTPWYTGGSMTEATATTYGIVKCGGCAAGDKPSIYCSSGSCADDCMPGAPATCQREAVVPAER